MQLIADKLQYSLKFQAPTDVSAVHLPDMRSTTKLHSPQYTHFMICLNLDAGQPVLMSLSF